MGPDVDLIYDAVFAHTRQEALAVGRELERLGYFWYEAPLPPDDIEGYVDLRSRVDVPLTVELIYATQYREYVRRQAVTYLRTLSGIRDGITEMRKAAAASSTAPAAPAWACRSTGSRSPPAPNWKSDPFGLCARERKCRIVDGSRGRRAKPAV